MDKVDLESWKWHAYCQVFSRGVCEWIAESRRKSDELSDVYYYLWYDPAVHYNHLPALYSKYNSITIGMVTTKQVNNLSNRVL